jgi:hypothetical protein
MPPAPGARWSSCRDLWRRWLVDARELGAALSQSALGRLSGDDGRPKPDPWRQLSQQCARAARGDDPECDGTNYLTVRF